LKAAWNEQAYQFNQWDDLGIDEIVAFAQKQEREKCAAICDEIANSTEPDDFAIDAVNEAAISIRNRGGCDEPHV